MARKLSSEEKLKRVVAALDTGDHIRKVKITDI